MVEYHVLFYIWNFGMHDLNDLYYFAMVVDHGGFAAAERALGIPKSRLSRRISQLETDLGVRLLQRSTRRFAVTDVGTSVHRHAQTMLAEAQAAREVVDRLSAEPRGLVRASVPVSLAQMQLPKLLPKFLAQYPKVRLQLNISNRRVDIINEGYDVALRVRSRLDDDGSLVMRSFGQVQELLVASPKYLDRAGRPKDPDELANHVTLSISEDEARQRWELHARRRGTPRGPAAARGRVRLPAAAEHGEGRVRHHHAARNRLRRRRPQRRAGSGAARVVAAAGHLPRRVRLASRPAAGGARVHRLPGRTPAAAAGGLAPAL